MEFVKNGEQDQTNCWLDVEGEVDVIDLGHDGQRDDFGSKARLITDLTLRARSTCSH